MMNPAKSIRVGVVVNRLPRMLQEITAEILTAEGDIEVVTIHAQNDPDLIAQVAGLDALVTGAQPPSPALLFARPCMAVIEVADDGRTSTLHCLQPVQRTTRPLSGPTLIRSLREAVDALRGVIRSTTSNETKPAPQRRS